MFAVGLAIERDPMQWADMPVALKAWVQNAGGVAMVALAIWGLAYLIRRPEYAPKTWNSLARAVMGLGVAAGAVYALVGVFMLAQVYGITRFSQGLEQLVREIGLTAGGAFALAAVLLPIVTALASRLRVGRIWALARLSLKEAVRSRVVLVFGVMAIIFLFADWFVPYKPEDQVRNYVRVVYWSMAPLFLLTASLLGAFGIPADVRSQAIHTIVTKPVERFEIVLGRFLGYGMLLTAGLGLLTGVSLLYIWRGVNPRAAEESFKARVPVYGSELWFWGTRETGKKSAEGTSVGREWGYRSYISGPHPRNPGAPKQYAVWSFDNVPRYLGDDLRPVRFEFTFDIFRLSKGDEGLGVFCTFTFADGRLSVPQLERLAEQWRTEYNQRFNEAQKKLTGASFEQEKRKIEESLIAKYGLYEARAVEVMDYHTQAPGRDEETRERIADRVAHLFKRLNELDDKEPRQAEPGVKGPPALNVFVNVDRTSGSQMLGVAKRDLYMLTAERSFFMNFLKGMVGMWFVIMLVLGVAVTCSTYLSGVISWFTTLFLYLAGSVTDYIQQLAEGRAVGGGPVESALRLFTHQPQGAPLDPTPTASVVQSFDDIYRWWLRRFLSVVPDVGRFDLHQYVANGFDIPWTQVLMLDNLLPLVGFLLPCAILGFYLMKFREIANPT
jgi:hypothetical protein